MEKQKISNPIPFKFEYNIAQKSNKNLSIAFTSFFITAFLLIAGSIIMKNINLYNQEDKLNFQQNNITNVEKVEFFKNKTDLFNQMNFNKEKADYESKITRLSSVNVNLKDFTNYPIEDLINEDKSKFLNSLNEMTYRYRTFHEEEYNKLHSFLRNNPSFYHDTINILNKNKQSVVAFLLYLDIAPRENGKYIDESALLKYTYNITENEINHPLIVKIEENKFLSHNFKALLGKEMLVRLDKNIMYSDNQFRYILINNFTIKEQQQRLNINNNEIEYQIRLSLKKESELVVKNIFKLYPEAPLFYRNYKNALTGITKFFSYE